jgi:hypothetical protein
MITITGKVKRHGHETTEQVSVPANHTEASGGRSWGMVIAGGLLLLAATLICLLLFSR